MERLSDSRHTVGIFSLHGGSAEVKVEVPDGEYTELLRGGSVLVKNGQVACTGEPIIFTLPR